MNKPTKQETKKVVTAIKRRFWANKEDLPTIADSEYRFTRHSNCQEIHWEGGDFDWAVEFSAQFNDSQDKFYVEPFNGFVLCVWKR